MTAGTFSKPGDAHWERGGREKRTPHQTKRHPWEKWNFGHKSLLHGGGCARVSSYCKDCDEPAAVGGEECSCLRGGEEGGFIQWPPRLSPAHLPSHLARSLRRHCSDGQTRSFKPIHGSSYGKSLLQVLFVKVQHPLRTSSVDDGQLCF